MTTDDFTEAARKAAESDLAHLRGNEEYADGYRDGHRQGSAWARTRLAAQEPTDAEVEAAATAGLDAVSPTWRASMSRPSEDDLAFTRAALSAARAARRDEEKR